MLQAVDESGKDIVHANVRPRVTVCHAWQMQKARPAGCRRRATPALVHLQSRDIDSRTPACFSMMGVIALVSLDVQNQHVETQMPGFVINGQQIAFWRVGGVTTTESIRPKRSMAASTSFDRS